MPVDPNNDSTTFQTSNTLRQQLKSWEKSFALSHAGRKATRDEIKADPAIGLRFPPSHHSTGD